MKEKKAYHFNWVDALVCLLVAALALGAFYKFTVSDKTSSVTATETITYVVQVLGGKDSSLSAFREGDALYDSDSGTQIGTITKVEAVPAETIVPLPDGTAEWGTMEGRSDVYLTVEATGTVTDSRQYLVNKTYQINVGSLRNFNTKYRSFEGTIWSIG